MMKPTKVLVLSRYGPRGPSSRYRFYQYLPHLKAEGFECVVSFLLDDAYLRNLASGKRHSSLLSILWSYLKRFFLLFSRQYDLIWLEKELFPWLPGRAETLLFKLFPALVIDYDDAVFHRYDLHRSRLLRRFLGKKITRIMGKSDVVVAGNDYIADYAIDAKAPCVRTIPTVVDSTLFRPKQVTESETPFTIGWIGTPATTHYLSELFSALRELCRDATTRIVVIGGRAEILGALPVTFKNWSESTEVEEILQFDVGIMPLSDTPWDRGKCGLKLIQYMACGIPAVAAPVGVNREIIDHGVDGFHAGNQEDWIHYLKRLRREPELRARMGKAGRSKVESQYCLQVWLPRLVETLRSPLKNRE